VRQDGREVEKGSEREGSAAEDEMRGCRKRRMREIESRRWMNTLGTKEATTNTKACVGDGGG